MTLSQIYCIHSCEAPNSPHVSSIISVWCQTIWGWWERTEHVRAIQSSAPTVVLSRTIYSPTHLHIPPGHSSFEASPPALSRWPQPLTASKHTRNRLPASLQFHQSQNIFLFHQRKGSVGGVMLNSIPSLKNIPCLLMCWQCTVLNTCEHTCKKVTNTEFHIMHQRNVCFSNNICRETVKWSKLGNYNHLFKLRERSWHRRYHGTQTSEWHYFVLLKTSSMSIIVAQLCFLTNITENAFLVWCKCNLLKIVKHLKWNK